MRSVTLNCRLTGSNLLTFFLTSFWHIFWQSFWHIFWHSFWHIGMPARRINFTAWAGEWWAYAFARARFKTAVFFLSLQEPVSSIFKRPSVSQEKQYCLSHFSQAWHRPIIVWWWLWEEFVNGLWSTFCFCSHCCDAFRNDTSLATSSKPTKTHGFRFLPLAGVSATSWDICGRLTIKFKPSWKECTKKLNEILERRVSGLNSRVRLWSWPRTWTWLENECQNGIKIEFKPVWKSSKMYMYFIWIQYETVGQLET